MHTTLAAICLGSNQGEAHANLARALALVGAHPNIQVLQASPVYMTEPQGLRDQPFFANQVALLACDTPFRQGSGANIDGAKALLNFLLATEAALGRTRTGPRFGPRVIDIDLLTFGNTVHSSQHLTLPHPRMLERAFVLVPFADIAKDMLLPQGLSVHAALAVVPHRIEGNMIYQEQEKVV